MKEFVTVNAGIISLVVSPEVTLLRCNILLISDVGFTKVDSTPLPLCFLLCFPNSFVDIFLSQLLHSSASFPILELTIKGNTRNTMGFHRDNMPTPSELDTSQRSAIHLEIFLASSSEHFDIR